MLTFNKFFCYLNWICRKVHITIFENKMFCLYNSSKLSRPKFEFSLKVKVIGLNPGYLLECSLLYPKFNLDPINALIQCVVCNLNYQWKNFLPVFIIFFSCIFRWVAMRRKQKNFQGNNYVADKSQITGFFVRLEENSWLVTRY